MIKKVLSFLTLFFIVVSLSNAQEQLEHKWKTYVSEDGHFYVNKNLPIYLWISTSPSENAKKHRLRSESCEKYTNPLYFDTEGWNTVRTPSKVDTVTKKAVVPREDIIFEVYADGKPPKTTADFTIAQNYTKEGITYYGKGLEIDLSSNDAVSGIEGVYYSINGKPYKKYTEKFTIDEDGKIVLKYYAADRVGNAEEPHTKEFWVDRTPPITEYKIKGESKDGWVGPGSKFVLESQDELSGVKKTLYSIDGGTEHLYRGPIDLKRLKLGEHTLMYFSIDNVDNNNAGNTTINKDGTYDFNYDNSPPVAELSFEGDHYKGKYDYVSERTKVKLDATDKESGVLKIMYGLNTSKLENDYKSPFEFEKKSGLQSVYYAARDQVANVSNTKKQLVYLDKKAPVTGITFGKPQFFNRDSLFITKNTKITLFSRDTQSGVKKTEYAIDDGNYQKYTDKFTINKDDAHLIRFRTIDNVNNQEQQKESLVVLDNKAPEIYINFSIKPIREEKKDGKTMNVYPTYTKLYLGATDKYAGTETIYYQIDDGPMRKYVSAENIANANLLTKEKTYKVRVVAKDKLGNESEKSVEFVVSEK